MSDYTHKLIEIANLVTTEQIESMKMILNRFTFEMVDDLSVCGRVYPALHMTTLSRIEIETEFMQIAITEYFYLSGLVNLTGDQRKLGVILYVTAVDQMSSYKVYERLDMLFKVKVE